MTYKVAKAGGDVYDGLGLRFLPLRSQVGEGRTGIDLGNVSCVGSGGRAVSTIKFGLRMRSIGN